MIGISQSIIKGFQAYKLQEECGLYYQHYYLDHPYTSPDTEAQRLGRVFENVCAYGIPGEHATTKKIQVPLKEGEVNPDNPKRKTKDILAYSEPDQRAINQGYAWRAHIDALGFRVVANNVSIKPNTTKAEVDVLANYMSRDAIEYAIKEGHTCQLDFLCAIDHAKLKEANPDTYKRLKDFEHVIIDTKYTGLFNNKWEKWGWELESLPYKHDLTIQAVHYSYITGLPFIWAVYENQPAMRSKFILAEIDSVANARHELVIDQTREAIENELKRGFRPFPTLERCGVALWLINATIEQKRTLLIFARFNKYVTFVYHIV